MRRGLGNRKRRTAADDAAELERQKLEAEAVRLRTQEFLSYPEIAKRVDRSVGWAWNAVNKRRQVNPDRDRYVAEANGRIEPVLDVMRDQALDGDTQAANALAKLTTTHAEINGYKSAEKIQVEAAATVTVDAARTAMAAMFGGKVLPPTNEPGKPE